MFRSTNTNWPCLFVNGIQSASRIVISVPVPTPAMLMSPIKSTNGSLQFAFANSVGALFGVLATTNLSLSQTNWTPLGGRLGNFSRPVPVRRPAGDQPSATLLPIAFAVVP